MTHLEHFTFEACKINICFVAMHWLKIVFLCHMSYWPVCTVSAQCQFVSYCSGQFWEHSAHYDKGTASRKMRWFSFLLQRVRPPKSVSGIQLKSFFFQSLCDVYFGTRSVQYVRGAWVTLLAQIWSKTNPCTPSRSLNFIPLFISSLSLSLCSTFFTHFLWLCN